MSVKASRVDAPGSCQSQGSAVICQPVTTRPYTDKDDPIKIGGQIVIDRTKVWSGWKHKSTLNGKLGLGVNVFYKLMRNIAEIMKEKKTNLSRKTHWTQ